MRECVSFSECLLLGFDLFIFACRQAGEVARRSRPDGLNPYAGLVKEAHGLPTLETLQVSS